MSGRRGPVAAAVRAFAFWAALSVGAALLLRAMRGPGGEAPPVEGALLVPYYALALFEVPGLVFVPTACGSLVTGARLASLFESAGFSIAVGLVNGFCWACMVAIGRASIRRRRTEVAIERVAESR